MIKQTKEIQIQTAGTGGILPETSGRSWSVSGQRKTAVQWIGRYLELTKPRIMTMVLLSTAIGFYLGSGSLFRAGQFLFCLFATALVGGGAMALNEYLEYDCDAKMIRTRNRPIPAGDISPAAGLLFGTVLSVAGFCSFFFLVHPLSLAAAAVTSLSYLFAYTPLKKKTYCAVFAGALPGALPPLIGWTAAAGAVTLPAVSLFLILFFWQIPHFLSIDVMYRADYARAGFPTLAVIDKSGKATARYMASAMSILICVSLLPTLFGTTRAVYLFGAFALGICFWSVVVYALSGLKDRMRYVLRASVIYLACLFILMVVDKV